MKGCPMRLYQTKHFKKWAKDINLSNEACWEAIEEIKKGELVEIFK